MSTARSKLLGYTAVIKRDKEFALETNRVAKEQSMQTPNLPYDSLFGYLVMA